MMAVSPEDYAHWMRWRLPELNKGIDAYSTSDVLSTLAREAIEVCGAITRDRPAIPSLDIEREKFTYISMVHASLYRHKRDIILHNAPLPAYLVHAVENVEELLVKLASSLGVESRFLSSFYLMYNPGIEGRRAQFRPGKDESEFVRANQMGIVQYKLAALALLRTMKWLVLEKPSPHLIVEQLREASEAFSNIVEGNRDLAHNLDKREFEFLTEYFSTVEVQGRTLRGVNAGDQPWSYIIDLLLGVDLKQAFQIGFDRDYPSDIETSVDVVSYEFKSGNYLKSNYLLPEDYEHLTETLGIVNNGPDTLLSAIENCYTSEGKAALIMSLHSVMKSYIMTSNTHYGLAKKYVPADPSTGTQIGSSGTNIDKFLKKGLIEERMKRLHDLETNYPEIRAAQSFTIVASS